MPKLLADGDLDILDCLAQLSNDQVPTLPSWRKQLMLAIPSSGVWADPQLTWLDPFCKSGVFLRRS